MGPLHFRDAFGVEVRDVGPVEHEGRPAVAATGSRLYPTSPDDLWSAITEPERLARWFAPVEGNLELGGRYAIQGNAEGTITRCDRHEALELTWEFGGTTSWVAVRLEAEGDGTRLVLVHTVATDGPGEEHWQTYGPGSRGVGWDLAFLGLALYLEHGEAFDQAEAMAWLGTDPGKAFMTDCAMAWGQAHVAGGGDPTVANAMAERTASFYRGEE